MTLVDAMLLTIVFKLWVVDSIIEYLDDGMKQTRHEHLIAQLKAINNTLRDKK